MFGRFYSDAQGPSESGLRAWCFSFLVRLAGASRGPPEHRHEASRIHFSTIRWFPAPLAARAGVRPRQQSGENLVVFRVAPVSSGHPVSGRTAVSAGLLFVPCASLFFACVFFGDALTPRAPREGKPTAQLSPTREVHHHNRYGVIDLCRGSRCFGTEHRTRPKVVAHIQRQAQP